MTAPRPTPSPTTITASQRAIARTWRAVPPMSRSSAELARAGAAPIIISVLTVAIAVNTKTIADQDRGTAIRWPSASASVWTGDVVAVADAQAGIAAGQSAQPARDVAGGRARAGADEDGLQERARAVPVGHRGGSTPRRSPRPR